MANFVNVGAVGYVVTPSVAAAVLYIASWAALSIYSSDAADAGPKPVITMAVATAGRLPVML